MPASRKKKKTKRRTTTRRSRRGAPYVVFISHSSADLWIAEQIAKEIAALGAKPWLDELDLEGGDDIRERVINGVASCREMIVLITPESVKSRWVSFEIGAASGQKKRVTPILHYVQHGDVEVLANMKAYDLNKFGQYLTQLKLRLRR